MATFRDVVHEIHETLDDKSVKELFGRKALKEHNQVRRIVWIRPGGDVRPAEDKGGKLLGDTRHRVIYTLGLDIEAHIYAENEDATETLFTNLLAAVYANVGPNMVAGRFDWETESDARDVAKGHTVRGPKIKFAMVWRAPVTDEIAKLTTLEQQTHTGEFQNAEGTTTEVVC